MGINTSMDILTEASADYKNMINALIGAIILDDDDTEQSITDKLSNRYSEKIIKEWNDRLTKARTVLKKDDRVMWLMRITRYNLVEKWKGLLDPKYASRVVADFQRAYGWDHETDVDNILLTLEHYLSLPIAEIQAVPFDAPLEAIEDRMKEAQAEWRKRMSRFIDITGDENVIIQDGDWYWVNLDKAFCDREGAAMGHCGNEPRSDSRDKILSLRKKVKNDDGQTRWEPHATFILDGDNLTEMKGRNNEKPAPDTHPMIVRLIMSRYVDGIIGGGYAAENNFSIRDLPEEQWKEIIKQKPSLATMADLIDIYGIDDKRVWEKVDDTLSLKGIPSIEGHHDDDTVLLARYSVNDIQYMANSKDDEAIFKKEYGPLADEYSDIIQATFENYPELISIVESALGMDLTDGEDETGTKAAKIVRYIFPNSATEMEKELRDDFSKACDTHIENFINHELSPKYYQSYPEITTDQSGDIEVLVLVSQKQFLDDLAEYSNDGENYSDFEFPHRYGDSEWLVSRDGYYGEDQENDFDIDEEFSNIANRHIRSLFFDPNQLQFDFM